MEPRPDNPESNIDRKEKAVTELKNSLEKIDKNFAFIVYGSVGRGCYGPESDIDSMVIFPMKEAGFFISDDFIEEVPLDDTDSNIFDPEDIEDLVGGEIDFLRLKGRCLGEELELQFFPFSKLKKASGIFVPNLHAGTKRSSGQYKISDNIQERPTIDFTGSQVFFKKRPTLSESGKREDISEVGTYRKSENWVRGLTLGKLLSPRIVIDRIGFEEYLDKKILRGIIRSMWHHQDLYRRNDKGRIIGIDKRGLDYRILDPLFRSHKNGANTTTKPDTYNFGEKEEAKLKARFEKQANTIIKRDEYQIYD